MENFEVYEDVDGEWRFRVKGNNGLIVSTSSESYVSKSNAQRGVEDLKAIVASGLTVEEVEGETSESRREADGGLARTPTTKVQEYIAAAHCYLSAAHRGNAFDMRMVPMDWPWRAQDWKPGSKLENMEKAEAILRKTIDIYKSDE